MRLLLLPLLLVACGPSTTATLGGESSSDDINDTTDNGETGSDTDTDPYDTDTDTEQKEEEDLFPFLGDYFGTMDVIASSSWGDYDVGDCEVSSSVDEAGEMLGGAECTLDIGWGGEDVYAYELTAFVDEDGAVEGEMPLEFGDGDDYTMTISGTAEEDGVMNLTFSVGGDFQLLGEAELVREN